MKNRDSPYERIYAVIARIPPGRVATYGQIAALAGLPRQARRVGHALRIQPDGAGLPWHRVINAQGGISDRGMGWEAGYQRHLLEEEGVVFDTRGRIDLDRFGWEPEASSPGRKARPPGPSPRPSPRGRGRVS